MNILITGSSGLIGTALAETLSSRGYQIFKMRRTSSQKEPFHWLPDELKIHWDTSVHIDVVIHLAGANIAAGRWSETRKKEILDSREKSTHLIADTLAGLKNPPKLLISASAIGFYGDTADRWVDERNRPGYDFLSEVCLKWEKATLPASESGIRTVLIRTGMVLSAKGGALKKMLLPFQLGLGGKMGSGKQFVSWVSLDEVVEMVRFIIDNEAIHGPVNLVSPNPVTNAVFAKTLGAVLKRPAIFPIPAFMLKLLWGEMAEALILASNRVKPKALELAGYSFIHQDLENALNCVLNKNEERKV